MAQRQLLPYVFAVHDRLQTLLSDPKGQFDHHRGDYRLGRLSHNSTPGRVQNVALLFHRPF